MFILLRVAPFNSNVNASAHNYNQQINCPCKCLHYYSQLDFAKGIQFHPAHFKPSSSSMSTTSAAIAPSLTILFTATIRDTRHQFPEIQNWNSLVQLYYIPKQQQQLVIAYQLNNYILNARLCPLKCTFMAHTSSAALHITCCTESTATTHSNLCPPANCISQPVTRASEINAIAQIEMHSNKGQQH